MKKIIFVLMIFLLFSCENEIMIESTTEDQPIVEEVKVREYFDPEVYGLDLSQLEAYQSKGYITPLVSLTPSSYDGEGIDTVNLRSFKTFTGQVQYDITEYSWNQDEISWTLEHDTTVYMDDTVYFEEDVINETEKVERYYDDQSFYEIYKYGDDHVNPFITRIVNEIDVPHHLPLRFKRDEMIHRKLIVEEDNRSFLYLEFTNEQHLIQRWMDIETGLIFKEHAFDFQGRIKISKHLNSFHTDTFDKTLLNVPAYDYQDYTSFFYKQDLEILYHKINMNFSYPCHLVLSGDKDIHLYAKGTEDNSLYQPMYEEGMENQNGELVDVLYYENDLFYTIVDAYKKGTAYGRSYLEKNFYDMSLPLLYFDDERIQFYHENIHGAYEVYEYFDDISQVFVYQTNDLNNLGEATEYQVRFESLDESIFEFSRLNDYEIIDYGIDSIDDGEHPPFWFVTESSEEMCLSVDFTFTTTDFEIYFTDYYFENYLRENIVTAPDTLGVSIMNFQTNELQQYTDAEDTYLMYEHVTEEDLEDYWIMNIRNLTEVYILGAIGAIAESVEVYLDETVVVYDFDHEDGEHIKIWHSERLNMPLKIEFYQEENKTSEIIVTNFNENKAINREIFTVGDRVRN